MSSYQVYRGLEKGLKVSMKRAKRYNFWRHIHQDVYITVGTILPSRHRSEQTQTGNPVFFLI